jgi:hypothetical protein
MATEEWVEAAEAATILTANSGHTIRPDYLRVLARKGKLTTKTKDRRSKFYLKSDLEAYKVEQRTKKP